jgi:hypothetical protein
MRGGWGKQIREYVEKELRIPAEIEVIREGTIPVQRKLKDEEAC